MFSVLRSSYLFINIIESICETPWQDGDGFRLTYVGGSSISPAAFSAAAVTVHTGLYINEKQLLPNIN